MPGSIELVLKTAIPARKWTITEPRHGAGLAKGSIRECIRRSGCHCDCQVPDVDFDMFSQIAFRMFIAEKKVLCGVIELF